MSAFPESATRLTEAAEYGDKASAWAAAGQLVAWLSDPIHPINPQAAFTLVWTGAASKRWFDIAELVAGAFADRADATAGLRRLHAQMLMERGFYDEALARLEPLRGDLSLSQKDRVEVFGHIGRIHKDRFIAAAQGGNNEAAGAILRQACDVYLGSYQEDPSIVWHGINAVALLARPEAEWGDAARESQRLAKDIIAEVMRHDPTVARQYSAAILAEAHLALDNHAEALEWVSRHVANPAANAFAIGSPLRQFEQVWQLAQRPSPCPEILVLLRAALLDKIDGVVNIRGEDVRQLKRSETDRRYEAVFGADRFDSLDNYRRALERCACVARIGRSAETGVGTGFVVPGKLLSDRLDEGLVLVTNAHVVSETDVLRQAGAVHPHEAVVTFEAADEVPPSKEFGLETPLFHSPPEALDVAIMPLSSPLAPSVTYPLARVLPVVSEDTQVRVIGHPSGRGLSISSNRLLDQAAPKIHYRTATEGGSSGSPVFTREWKLLGVHHEGGDAMPRLSGQPGTYPANEGIFIGSIREALNETLG